MIETNLDFYVLGDTEPNKIVIADVSTYFESPQTPILSIVLPGFKKPINLPYNPSNIIPINTSLLGLSAVGNFKEFSDGVYEISLSICPNDELRKTKFFLIDNHFKQLYAEKLLSYLEQGCHRNKEIEDKLNQIDLFIQAAHLLARRDNPIVSARYYQRALNLLTKLNCMI